MKMNNIPKDQIKIQHNQFRNHIELNHLNQNKAKAILSFKIFNKRKDLIRILIKNRI
jgi:hypothetical protein